ncbi:GGDEF domain-containing protein [Pseudorhodoferax sp. Leaf267]|uniref:GGDEF domain-containing protein n=1 Tax=Pseudorhodoferax sp. Leaf267 TaxID=1736316 RepID=UPI0007131FC3|nr:diguanylate cyclase [Pseudorhodoferax sp. Leaf267]KQP13780.1 hypothetical protein ASF43_18005 [Pseudorhodoferax sp. Leaf267]
MVRHYLTSESRLKNGKTFARLMMFVAVGGATTHLGFMAVFAWFGWHALVALNLVSVLVFVGIGVAIRRSRRYRFIANLAALEYVAHAVLAVRCLGWESGFHFYLMAVVAVFCIGTNLKPLPKWLTMAGMAMGYAALRYMSHQVAPWYTVSTPALHGLEYFNIIAMVLLLAMGASVHLGAVVRGEKMLLDLADTDPLTGLVNRRHWVEAAQQAQRRLREERLPFSVLLADVDHFKSINDRYGHAAGDEVLRAISQVLRKALRGVDTIGRWGGEEFAVLLSGADEGDASRVAEALRSQIAAMELRVGGQVVALSMTLGAAQAQHGEPVLAVVQRADVALYRGKAAGRNRVETSPAPLMPASGPA